jgi:hypothetical protein
VVGNRSTEDRTGWTVRKFVGTACRTVEIQADPHTITAADTLPDCLHQPLDRMHRHLGALRCELVDMVATADAMEGAAGGGLSGRHGNPCDLDFPERRGVI